jgi:hypothetical protein
MFLSGCIRPTYLSYCGDDIEHLQKEDIQTSVENVSAYVKDIDIGTISIGAFTSNQVSVIGLLIQIRNLTDQRQLINPEEFTVKSSDNYAIKLIDASQYINKEYTVNKYTGTVSEQDNPYSSLSNTFALIGADESHKTVKNYALNIDAHALKQPSFIEPNSFDYYYLFYEKPRSRSINIKFRGVIYFFRIA